ncbi:thialysine N-epsilon-acetyltransferase-like [Lucilia sericata]|uniref:thialysine N-epsilon-acetyltransferase-like n=1 Tax=Lucilia sericata TaxID=13632 RepID=UPI0018A7F36B|nr:thialysine N-epsilon-acetyltransferase-like [Lucilia sericata]
MTTKKQLNFRKAEIKDIKIVKDMIQELANLHDGIGKSNLTEEDLIRDSGLNGNRECCHIYVLELIEENQPTIIGYAICFFSYSTWQGRSYFLEDIYVRPKYRGIGAGARIFSEVAAKANEFKCKRLDFHVLAHNPATKFYKKMGASDLSETEEWRLYRLDYDNMGKLLEQLKSEK